MNEELVKDIGMLPINVIEEIEKEVNDFMEHSGLFCRVFSRQKRGPSVDKKVSKKNYNKEYKMQDLFGVRIALYFKDDVPICKEMLLNTFDVVGITEDKEMTSNFEPIRLNIVCRIPSHIKDYIDTIFWEKYPIDDTFEIQLRTVFSEGWHEIEHDLRYKCQEEWDEVVVMSRVLNGIFATLETCDWSIISLFEQLAYEKYKRCSWEAMLRNKLRIRMTNEVLADKIKMIFDEKREVSKEFFKLDREKMIKEMSSPQLSNIPKTMNNIVYIGNELFVRNEEIREITPSIIFKTLNK